MQDTFNHRVIVHCDLDCFYAQVEHKRLGVPMDVPLVVQQWEGLIAVNYAARKYGVTRGMRVPEAKRACPELRCVHVETIGGDGPNDKTKSTAHDRASSKVSLERYRRASVEIMAIFQRYTPLCERASIDEAYLDLTAQVEESLRGCTSGSQGRQEEDFGPADDQVPEGVVSGSGGSHVVLGGIRRTDALDRRLMIGGKLVAQLRSAVASELGYTVSAGIAHNKMLAKLASAKHKPNKQTIVPWHAVSEMMAAMALRSINGLGGKLGEAVEALRPPGGEMRTALDLQQIPETQLHATFDAKTATRLHRLCSDSEPSPKSINACKSFEPVYDVARIETWARILSDELAARLEEDSSMHERRPRSLVLHFRGVLGADHLQNWTAGRVSQLTGEHSKSCAMPPANGGSAICSADALCNAVMKLFHSCCPAALPCTRFAIGATDFQPLPSSGPGAITQFFAAASRAAPGAGDGASEHTSAHLPGLPLPVSATAPAEGARPSPGPRSSGSSSVLQLLTTAATSATSSWRPPARACRGEMPCGDVRHSELSTSEEEALVKPVVWGATAPAGPLSMWRRAEKTKDASPPEAPGVAQPVGGTGGDAGDTGVGTSGWWCSRCRRHVYESSAEHDDYHLAVQLQASSDPPAVSRPNTIHKAIEETRGRKRHVAKKPTESAAEAQKLEREQRRANRARVGQHFSSTLAAGSEASGHPEPEPVVQVPTAIFEEDMDNSDSTRFSSYLGKLPKYTGTKEEDRPKFVQDFILLCETVRRQHDASIRQKIRRGQSDGCLTSVQLVV
ncbi:hypothetical protein CYMTET_45871 [Cymbomonas tetramitiformis]|uniref:DNA polymerase eta n=1 Tax=Cymbomonas tetramitiformis TaxID=36881 RepID=A0AAE0BXB1_9CHLO|nr:hypothetical protein CYMTET_45871 [Cymbomonas tetramitiformis]